MADNTRETVVEYLAKAEFVSRSKNYARCCETMSEEYADQLRNTSVLLIPNSVHLGGEPCWVVSPSDRGISITDLPLGAIILDNIVNEPGTDHVWLSGHRWNRKDKRTDEYAKVRVRTEFVTKLKALTVAVAKDVTGDKLPDPERLTKEATHIVMRSLFEFAVLSRMEEMVDLLSETKMGTVLVGTDIDQLMAELEAQGHGQKEAPPRETQKSTAKTVIH